MKEVIKVYSAGDYAGMHVGDTEFYYGYEVTNGTGDDWDEDAEWCFQVKEGGKEVYRKTASEIESIGGFDSNEPVSFLLVGIGIWLSDKLKDI